jgi:hypothetical protein
LHNIWKGKIQIDFPPNQLPPHIIFAKFIISRTQTPPSAGRGQLVGGQAVVSCCCCCCRTVERVVVRTVVSPFKFVCPVVGSVVVQVTSMAVPAMQNVLTAEGIEVGLKNAVPK